MDCRAYQGAVISLAIFLLFFGGTVLRAEDGSKRAEVPVDRIVVSLEEFQLLAFNGSKLVKAYPIATGADTGPTPTGSFEVINKLKNPWYTPDDKPAKAPGPDNPLGTRWIGIDKPSYGIHGTRAPNSIGTKASEGCLRMFNHHVEELFERVKIGTKVIIKDHFNDLHKQLVASSLDVSTESSS